MGTWGVGLYGSDFARDLRATIRAVSRLPFDGERLAQIVADTESAAASNPENEDHSTFWLVVADQFHRRGIAATLARDRALQIIDSGADLEIQRKLGQNASDLQHRARMLAELRRRLAGPPADKPRSVVRQPQPFLMDVGDVLIYPTCGGRPRNPYMTRPEDLKIFGPNGGQNCSKDGCGAIVIAERGRAFGFFAWYKPLVARRQFASDPPELMSLRQAPWTLELAGTCSPTHFRRMELQRVGVLPLDDAKLRQLAPEWRGGDSQAIADISIANRMTVRPADHSNLEPRHPRKLVVHLNDLVQSA
jgi:hypothetical protein